MIGDSLGINAAQTLNRTTQESIRRKTCRNTFVVTRLHTNKLRKTRAGEPTRYLSTDAAKLDNEYICITERKKETTDRDCLTYVMAFPLRLLSLFSRIFILTSIGRPASFFFFLQVYIRFQHFVFLKKHLIKMSHKIIRNSIASNSLNAPLLKGGRITNNEII